MPEPEYLTTREVAERFNLSTSWLTKSRVLGGANALPYIKIGRKVLYRADDVRAALSARARLNTSEAR